MTPEPAREEPSRRDPAPEAKREVRDSSGTMLGPSREVWHSRRALWDPGRDWIRGNKGRVSLLLARLLSPPLSFRVRVTFG